MNKYIVLVATLFIVIGFSTTIKTTISNPTGSNLIISGILGTSIIVGLCVFSKSDKKKSKDNYDGCEPID